MAIKENENKPATGTNRNSWKPEHEWTVSLPCGAVNAVPAKKSVDNCKSANSICNMLSNCYGVKKNKADNFTVYFQYSNKSIEPTVFISGCSDLTEEELVVQFNELKHGDVTISLTAEEKEAEWNN